MLALFERPELRSPAECLARPCPIPDRGGIYAWYFCEVPKGVPAADCLVRDGCTLLYVGISPSRIPSQSTLRTRIRTHLRGNASQSTFRLSLGCVLSTKLGIELRRVRSKSKHRLTFAEGESKLCAWLERNARVAWSLAEEPWEYEHALISRVSLPLNIDANRQHVYRPTLKLLRDNARKLAETRPVLAR